MLNAPVRGPEARQHRQARQRRFGAVRRSDQGQPGQRDHWIQHRERTEEKAAGLTTSGRVIAGASMYKGNRSNPLLEPIDQRAETCGKAGFRR